LFVGQRHRILSPRDQQAAGTWLAVNDVGMFAGLTNLRGGDELADAPSRGRLPHLALDQGSLESALHAVVVEIENQPYHPFQLVVSDGRTAEVLAHDSGELDRRQVAGGVAVVSNEHRLGELTLDQLDAALAGEISAEERLAALQPILLDPGGAGRHPILKKGEQYGTVSSSLIAVPRADPSSLIWRYAPGPPDTTPYRNYGNLGRRLSG